MLCGTIRHTLVCVVDYSQMYVMLCSITYLSVHCHSKRSVDTLTVHPTKMANQNAENLLMQYRFISDIGL